MTTYMKIKNHERSFTKVLPRDGTWYKALMRYNLANTTGNKWDLGSWKSIKKTEKVNVTTRVL